MFLMFVLPEDDAYKFSEQLTLIAFLFAEGASGCFKVMSLFCKKFSIGDVVRKLYASLTGIHIFVL